MLAASMTSTGPLTPTLPINLPSIRTPPLPLTRPVTRLEGPIMLISLLWDIANAARTVVHGSRSVTQPWSLACGLHNSMPISAEFFDGALAGPSDESVSGGGLPHHC